MTDRSFTITRTLDAPPALVFRAWTDPDQLGWFFSGHGEPEAPQVDLQVGGAWRQTMIISDDDRYVTGGVYREIVPGERLVFTWGAEDGWPELDDGAPVVTVALADAGGQTEMAVTVSLPESLSQEQVQEQLATGMDVGWNQTVDRLVGQLAGATS
jgi:uncharacterized protein YndB with AHSA1/START domain